LIARLLIYCGAFLAIVIYLLLTDAAFLRYLPFGSTDSIGGAVTDRLRP